MDLIFSLAAGCASNRPFRTGALRSGWVVTLAAVLLLLSNEVFSRSDADVLLEFYAAMSGRQLNGWRQDNVENMCIDWEGITCTPEGRVAAIQIAGTAEKGAFNGIIPSTITELQSLRELGLTSHNFVGELPPGVFSLPNMTSVLLSESPLSIKFPPNMSTSLRSLELTNTNFTGPLPESPIWQNIGAINLVKTQITCPLPESLVQRFATAPGNLTFYASSSWITIDENGWICGQIPPVSQSSLLVTPSLKVPPQFPSFPTAWRPRVAFRAEFGQMAIEFVGRQIFFFASFMLNGKRIDYRDEYAVVESHSSTQQAAVGDAKVAELLKMSNFTSFSMPTPSEVHANATLGSRSDLIVQWIINLDPTSKMDPSGSNIKFSFKFINVGHSWMDAQQYPYFVSSISMTLKGSHSPQSGKMMRCNSTDAKTLCADPTGSSKFEIFPEVRLVGDSWLSFILNKLTTKTIDLRFGYIVLGSIDGQVLTIDNVKTQFNRFFGPNMFFETITDYSAWNPTYELEMGPAGEQYINQILSLSVPLFNQYLFYDPDISIHILFDPSVNSAPVDESIQQGIIVATVVSVVVVALIIIVGVTVFVKWIFPYYKRKAALVEQVDEQSPTVETSRATWTAASPRA